MDFKIHKKSGGINVMICLRQSVKEQRESDSGEVKYFYRRNSVCWK